MLKRFSFRNLLKSYCNEFEKAHIDIRQTVNDAGLFIVKCALEHSSETSVIVSVDTEVLVLMPPPPPTRNICYYIKVGKN